MLPSRRVRVGACLGIGFGLLLVLTALLLAIAHGLNDNRAEAANTIRDKVRPEQIELAKRPDDMLQYLQESSKASADEACRALMLGLGALAVAFGVGIGWFISRSITMPLSQAVEVARRIADQDLTSKVQAAGDDETAQFLKALGEMNQTLSRIIGSVKAAADRVAGSAARTQHIAQDGSSKSRPVKRRPPAWSRFRPSPKTTTSASTKWMPPPSCRAWWPASGGGLILGGPTGVGQLPALVGTILAPAAGSSRPQLKSR